MKKFLFICLFLIQSALLLAVFDDYQPSAIARGMGGAYTAVSKDANAIFFNPAGLINTAFSAKLSFSQLYNQDFSELKTVALGYKLPKNLGTVAIGAKAMDVDF